MTVHTLKAELAQYDVQGLGVEIVEHHLSLVYPHGDGVLKRKAEGVVMSIAMKADLSVQVYDHPPSGFVRLYF